MNRFVMTAAAAQVARPALRARCLAMHVALWTGLKLSLTKATFLRCSLLFLSGAALLFLFASKRKRRAGAA